MLVIAQLKGKGIVLILNIKKFPGHDLYLKKKIKKNIASIKKNLNIMIKINYFVFQKPQRMKLFKPIFSISSTYFYSKKNGFN